MTYLNELSMEESRAINGGAPTEETSLAYDFTHIVVSGIKWVVDLF